MYYSRTVHTLSSKTMTTPELPPRATTIDFVHRIECRQFIVGQNNPTFAGGESTSPTAMQMTHSGALVGNFHHVVDELKSYHDEMATQCGKRKKRVRFQSEEKLHTCIPDVLRRCDLDGVDKKPPLVVQKPKVLSHDASIWDELDETKNLLISAGDRKSKFVSLIKRRLIKGIFQKMCSRKCRKVPDGVVSNKEFKETKAKQMERSNSYCRLDDADNVILIDEIDDNVYNGCDDGPIVAWNISI